MANAAPLITQTSHEHSSDTSQLFAALAEAQAEFKEVQKTGYNPFFESNFASLKDVKDATEEALRAHNLVITQFPGQTVTGEPALTTWLVHTASGQYLADTAALSLGKKDPQALGSAITYMRRYTRKAILDLLDEENDDDANAATHSDAKVNTGQVTKLRAEFESLAKKVFPDRDSAAAFWKEKGFSGKSYSNCESIADLTEAVKLLKALKSGAE